MQGNGIAWDARSARLYISIPIAATANGGSVAVVDPENNRVADYIRIAGDPSNLALSDDGQYLYVGLATPRSVLRIRLATRQVQAELRLDDTAGPALGEIADLAVMPGQPGTTAVLLKPAVYETNSGLIVYRGKEALRKHALQRAMSRVLFSLDEPDRLFALDRSRWHRPARAGRPQALPRKRYSAAATGFRAGAALVPRWIGWPQDFKR